MEILTVKQAVKRVLDGGDLKDIQLDKASTLQVNVRDAMVLNSGGIVLPEENVYYDDSDIEVDEEIDDLIIGAEITGMSWAEKAKRAENFSRSKSVSIDIAADDTEIEKWIEQNKSTLGRLLKPIIVNLFNAEKTMERKPIGE